MLTDDDLLMVGSANCDNRSMRLNFELNVLAHGLHRLSNHTRRDESARDLGA